MRSRVQRGRLAAIQGRVLPVWNCVSDLRRGDDFPAAVCGGFWGPFRGRVGGDDDLPFAPGRRPGLGVAKGCADVEVKPNGILGCWSHGELECRRCSTLLLYCSIT